MKMKVYNAIVAPNVGAEQVPRIRHTGHGNECAEMHCREGESRPGGKHVDGSGGTIQASEYSV